ncbi:MAG: DJ-1 family glyoxalase III [Thermodesulfobacteriota bacterium]
MSKTALVPIADGAEEIEAVTIIDVLRRAGVDVTVASVESGLEITASRGVRIVADKAISECVGGAYDLIALPGGMPGAEHLRESTDLLKILKRQHQEDRLFGAICAAPAVVLHHHGFLKGRRATAHPGFMDRLDADQACEERVVTDGLLVTSRGPGTALEHALRLVALLYDEQKAAEVAGPMVVKPAQD